MTFVLKLMNFVTKMMHFVVKAPPFVTARIDPVKVCSKCDEFCISNDDFCIKKGWISAKLMLKKINEENSCAFLFCSYSRVYTTFVPFLHCFLCCFKTAFTLLLCGFYTVFTPFYTVFVLNIIILTGASSRQRSSWLLDRSRWQVCIKDPWILH